MNAIRIDHVGIVVDDLAQAAAFVTGILGFAFDREAKGATQVKAAWYRCGTVSVELIEFLDPVQRAGRLGSALARIEHIAIEVDDVEVAAADLRSKGGRLNAPKPVIFNGIRSYFSVPESTAGIEWQLMDRRG